MEEPENHPRARSRWSRIRWWLAGGLLGLVVLLAVAWVFIERAIDVEQYRPRVVAELARITGQPVSVDRLDLAWRPVPCLSALDVTVGEGAFAASASRIDVYPAFHTLLWRELRIPRISLHDLVLTQPEAFGEAQEAWDALVAHIREATAPDDAVEESSGYVERVQVGTIAASDAAIRLGPELAPALEAAVKVKHVTSPELDVDVDARFPGKTLRISGGLAIPVGDAPGLLHGMFALRDLRSEDFRSLPTALQTGAQARVDVQEQAEGGFVLGVQGQLAPEGDGALGGDLSGELRFGEGGPGSLRAELQGEGLTVHARGELGDEPRLRVESLELAGEALASLLRGMVEGPVQLVPVAADARIRLSDLVLAFPDGASPRAQQGRVELAGLGVARDGERFVSDLAGAGRFDAGVLRLESLRGGPLTLRGAIEPAPDMSHVRLDLSGSLRVEDAWLHGLGVPGSVSEMAGQLEIASLTGALPPAPDRAPLDMRVRLREGRLRVGTDAFEDRISRIDLRVEGEGGARRLRLDGTAFSETAGDVALSATLLPERSEASGTLELDIGALSGLARDAEARARLAPALESLGRSRIGFELSPVEEREGVLRLALERPPPPALEATIDLHTGGDGALLGDVEATLSRVPASALRGVVAEDVRLSGTGTLLLRRSRLQDSYSIHANLDQLGFASGDFVEKAVGEPLSLRIERSATTTREVGAPAEGSDWRPRELALASRDGLVVFGLEEGALVAPKLDVNLADWSFLLVESASLSGRLRGAIDTRVGAADLVLDGAALQLSPDLGLDEIDGEIEIQQEGLRVRDLTLRRGGSDATFDATLSGGQLEGSLRGERLDVDVVQALVREVALLLPDDPDAEPSEPIDGALAVQLDRVGYRRAEAYELRADVKLQQSDLSVRNLSFDTYQGRVTGTLDVDAEPDLPSRLGLELTLEQVGGRFLEEILLEEPNGWTGSFDGELRFQAPLRGDVRATFADAAGSIEARGAKGSYGRAGLATKLISVLRSTEMLRLRMPSLQDEGLVFDTTELDLAMEEGVATVRKFSLESPSYAIDAKGTLDFRKDESKLPIEVNAIRGLTSFVEFIPIAGDALKIVNVRLVATGSPWDLEVGVASVRDQIVGAGMAGPNAVIKGVRDAIRMLPGAGRGREAEAPVAEPSAETQAQAPAAEPSAETQAQAPAAEPSAETQAQAPVAEPSAEPSAPTEAPAVAGADAASETSTNTEATAADEESEIAGPETPEPPPAEEARAVDDEADASVTPADEAAMPEESPAEPE